MNQILTFLKKRKLEIIFFIFLMPFLLVTIGDTIYSAGNLYTLGISLKDFFTLWIAIFGAIGIVYNISQNQKRITQQEKQIDILHKDRRDSRFSKGVEILGNNSESTRIGGIYDLYFLAQEFPNDYGYCIFNILCSHVRTMTSNTAYLIEHKDTPSNETQITLDILTKEYSNIFKNFTLDLHGSYLAGINLQNKRLNQAKLENISFKGAFLAGALFQGSWLKNSNFEDANLILSNLSNAIIDNANFDNANLKMADLSNARLNKSTFSFTNLEQSNFENTYIFKDQLSTANTEKTDLSKIVDPL